MYLHSILRVCTTRFEPEIRRHPTFHTDVSDNNQSTECRQQDIYSVVDYPTLWSQNSDSCSGGYPTLPCQIFDVCEPKKCRLSDP